MTREEFGRYIMDHHNVFVNLDTMMYTRGNFDDDFGWLPIPAEWIYGALEMVYHNIDHLAPSNNTYYQ